MTIPSTTEVTSTQGEAQLQQLEPAVIRLLAGYELRSSSSGNGTESEESSRKVFLVADSAPREAQPQAFDPTLAAHPPIDEPVTNPEWWQQQYRRVPDYRPVNRGLDLSERKQEAITTIVGSTILIGCCAIAVSALTSVTFSRGTDRPG
jgi:hypothetical protein